METGTHFFYFGLGRGNYYESCTLFGRQEKMGKITGKCCFACLMTILSACSLMDGAVSDGGSKIVLRDTFEGPGLGFSWPHSTSQNGMVVRRAEDLKNKYQTQAHGEKSLFVYDPDSRSHANASHHIPKIEGNEYMVEFYFWLPAASAFSTSGLYLYRPTRAGNPADITIVLDKVFHDIPDLLPHKWVLVIEDADGSDTIETYLRLDQWHRFQIYRHPDRVSGTGLPHRVDLYIDGDSIDSYSPLGGIGPPDTFLFGTTDPSQNGEGFWDDVIISLPPTGEHPKLLFDSAYVEDVLKPRTGNWNPTPVGVSYAELWQDIYEDAENYMGSDSIYIEIGLDAFTLYYPYSEEPPRHPDTNTRYSNYWSRVSSELQVRLETLSLVYLLTADTKFAARADTILLNVACWPQWTDPDYTGWAVSKYASLETGRLSEGFSLAYDMLFNYMDNYDKMAVQNAILSLGLGQLYLAATLYAGGKDPVKGGPNVYARWNGALGTSSLAIYGDSLSAELDTAMARVDALFSANTVAVDSAGGWVEGIFYANFGMAPAVLFAECYRQVVGDDIFFQQRYPKRFLHFLLHLLRPGPRPGRFVNFGDTHVWDPQREPMIRLASQYQDEFIQWLLSTYSTSGYKNSIFPFIWIDAALDTTHPRHLPDDIRYGEHFDGIGWATLRTGWDQEDFLLALKSGRGGSHTHQDQNNFVFGTDGKWLIADWGYVSYGSTDYSMEHAIAHNVIVVDDNPTQDVKRWGEETGDITNFLCSPQYGFVAGEASHAYADLARFFRKIVLVNQPSPYFIIRDQIASADGQPHHIDWLLHTWGEADHNGKDLIRIKHEDECVEVRILLPENTAIWDTSYQARKKSWRHIEVSPLDSMVEVDVLSAFLPYDSGQSPPSVEMVDGTTMMGVSVFGQFAHGIVMFSKDGDTIDKVEYSFVYSGSDTVVNILVDMRPDSRYRILNENLTTRHTTLQEVAATSEGTLSFVVANSAGSHRVLVIGEGLTKKSP